jgi:hypothetical protein
MYLSALSVEYVRAEVTATANPTLGTVEFAFTTTGSPSSWVAGSWEGSAVQSGEYWRATARVLVGPGFVTVPTGSVAVWCRLNASPESVVKVAGSVEVS